MRRRRLPTLPLRPSLLALLLLRRPGVILPEASADAVLDRSSSASKDDELDRTECLDACERREIGVGRAGVGSFRGAIAHSVWGELERPKLLAPSPVPIHCDRPRLHLCQN